MNSLFDGRPIIACSTGDSNAAIAIVRISGFASLSLFSDFLAIDTNSIKPRKAYFTNLLFDGEIIDSILLLFFEAPHSYNGENILEFHLHGNQHNVKHVMSIFLHNDICRMASPGEFTYRAYKNKKLSLSQIEGLDLLLNATSDFLLKQGQSILHGDLHKMYRSLLDDYITLQASLEIIIDFSEDVGERESRNNFDKSFATFFKTICLLNSKAMGSFSSLLNPSILLLGQTNAGKSSLFNLLLGEGRSIVSPGPGTTRDFISEFININNRSFRLIDTAGIRDSIDEIEQEGIVRAFKLIDTSFFKILLVNPFEVSDAYFDRFAGIDFDLLIFTHADLVGFSDAVNGLVGLPSYKNSFSISLVGPIEPVRDSGPIEPARDSGPIEPVRKIFSLVTEKYLDIISLDPIPVERHRLLINRLFRQTEIFAALLHGCDDFGILSSELRIIGNDISELLGIVSPDQVLSSIFENFCIGK